MSNYVVDLADQIIDQWHTAIRYGVSINRDSDLPPDRNQLINLLEIAFLASLTYDERRPTQFSIILCSQDDRNWMNTHPDAGSTPIQLSHPLPFDATQVRRLAPATSPLNVLIGVESVIDSAPTSLHIWGLLDIGSSWAGFLRHERDGANGPPNYLTVSSAEPGHLLVSYGVNTIATLRNGSIISRHGAGVLYSGPISEFFIDAQNECYHQACLRLENSNYSESDNDWPKRSYLFMIARLLSRIESQRHGGALLLIPDSWQLDRDAWDPVVSVKYAINDSRIWTHLIETLELHKRYYDLHFRLNESEVISRAEWKTYKSYNYRREEVKDQTDDLVSFAASLSGVDGAILMTDRLAIIGYGAEVTASAPVLRSIRLAESPDGTEGPIVPVDSFGTRHRAAFRFCWSLPQTVAFVVSLDGGVRAVRRVGNDVVLWPEALAAPM